VATRIGPRQLDRTVQAAPGPHEDARLFSDYMRLVRRHRLALAACLLAALTAGIGYVWVSRHSFVAVAVVGVHDPSGIISDKNDTLGLNLSMDSEVQVLESLPVTSAAATAIGTTAAEVGLRTSVSIPPNSRVLQIGYRSNSSKAAIDGANTVAQSYLKVRRAQYDARRNDQIARLKANLTVTSGLLAKAQKLADDPAQERPTRNSAGRTAQTLQSQVQRQTERIAALKALDITPGDLTAPASKASGPKTVNRLVPIATSLAIGLIGFVLLLPMLGRRRRVNKPTEARDLPDVKLAMPAPTGLRSTDQKVRRKALPAYLRLWGLVLAAERGSPRVVAVLPADNRLAARDVAIDLAAASGSQGVATALVVMGNAPWALLRALSMEDVGDPGNAHRQAVRVLGESLALPGVTLASLGQPSGMPVREAIREGLVWLGRNFDHIVVLASPPGTVEHQSLAWAASVPILVAERHQTRLTSLEASVAAVRSAGAKPPWVLVAGASGSTAGVAVGAGPDDAASALLQPSGSFPAVNGNGGFGGNGNGDNGLGSNGIGPADDPMAMFGRPAQGPDLLSSRPGTGRPAGNGSPPKRRRRDS
jgi:hypothetical protein